MNFDLRRVALIPLLASIVAMAVALSVQYVLGWKPCELCLMQRIPVVVAGVAAVGSLYPYNKPWIPGALIIISALFFLATAILAGYHVGVEQHWWLYEGACSRDPVGEPGVSNFAQALSKPAVVRCDQPPWSWHGLSLAGLNVLYSLAVALVIGRLFILVRTKAKEQ